MITMYFGPPGVGKTTLAARTSWWNHFLSKFGLNRYDRIYANFELLYTYQFDKNDIGHFEMSYDWENKKRIKIKCLLDEAGCDFHARRFKEMTDHQIEHFKKHRKYTEDWDIFSQSFDIDKVIRDLTPRLYYLKRGLLPNTIKALRIKKSMVVDKENKQMLDGYEFDPWFLRPFTTRHYYMPFYWHMFDSWDAPPLQKKEYSYCDKE